MTAYGQWTMTPPKDKSELQPPLAIENPLMNPLEHISRPVPGFINRKDSSSAHHDTTSEEQWLSQCHATSSSSSSSSSRCSSGAGLKLC